jgi:glycosyltransferase involved in cell wall biosynthesis
VTLFASGDSTTAARLVATFDEQMPDRIGETFYDVQHVATCLRRSSEFDVIHDHSGFAGVAFAELVDTPMVHTSWAVHSRYLPLLPEFRDSAYYVSISDYQRSCCPDLQHAGTVYNPIDVEGWPYRGRDEKEDYLLAFGRLCEDKGFHTAIEVANAPVKNW